VCVDHASSPAVAATASNNITARIVFTF
jgi:hypothetical protein